MSKDYKVTFPINVNVFVHWPDCPTGPGSVHFWSCICGGIVQSPAGTHHLSESVAACAGHTRPGEREGKDVFNGFKEVFKEVWMLFVFRSCFLKYFKHSEVSNRNKSS